MLIVKRSLSVIVVAILTACGGGGGGSDTPTPVTPVTPTPVTCTAPQFLQNGVCVSPLQKTVADLTTQCATDRQLLAYGFDPQLSADWDYAPNNGWGLAEGTTDVKFCTAVAALSPTRAIGRWTWDLGSLSANDASYVKGYTYIGQGVLPGFADHSPTFPKIINSFKELQVTWDTEITHAKSSKFINKPNGSVGDGGNLLLEIYISSNGNPTSLKDGVSSTKFEVSFNLVRWGSMEFETAGSQTVVIDGNIYKFFVRPNPPYIPQLNFVVADGYKPKGTMNLVKVLEWLKTNNYILDTDWVTTVQLGNEYSEGVGEAKFNLFELTYK